MPLVPGAAPNAGQARRLAIFQALAARKAQFASKYPNPMGIPAGQDPRAFMRARLQQLMAQHGQGRPPHPGHGGPPPAPPGGIPGPVGAPPGVPGPTPNITPEATTNQPGMATMGMAAPTPAPDFGAAAKVGVPPPAMPGGAPGPVQASAMRPSGFGGAPPGIPGGAPGPTMGGGGFGGMGGNNPLMIALMELMRRYQGGQQTPTRQPGGFPGGGGY